MGGLNSSTKSNSCKSFNDIAVCLDKLHVQS